MISGFATRVFGAAPLIECFVAGAVNPLRPHLTNGSRQEIPMRLDEAGFPQVGHNIVLIGLTGVLGFEARDNDYSYDMPYESRRTLDPTPPCCATVVLIASYAPSPTPIGIQLRGPYCLGGPVQRQTREQTLSGTEAACSMRPEVHRPKKRKVVKPPHESCGGATPVQQNRGRSGKRPPPI